MGEKIQRLTTSPLKVHITFTPKKSCIVLGRVSTKVVQRTVKFPILDFAIFFAFLNMGPYGGKVSNNTSPLKQHTRIPP